MIGRISYFFFLTLIALVKEPEDDLGAVQENLDADIDDNDGKDY